jgi:hypothetical protein
MRIYRSTLPKSCVCPALGFLENSGTAIAPSRPWISRKLWHRHRAIAAIAAAIAIGHRHRPSPSAPGPAPLMLDASRPFLHFLYDQPTGAILFMGRVLDPAQ